MSVTETSAPRDRRRAIAQACVAAIAFVALNFFVASWRSTLLAERESNLMLSPPPASGMARYDASAGEELERYWPAIPDARATRLVILSGMSQMYHVAGYRPGDEVIAELVDDQIRTNGARAFGLAAPNLNNQEALLLFLAASSEPRTKPAVFVYGICFDKYREAGVRQLLLDFLARHDAAARAWNALAQSSRSAHPLAAEAMLASAGAIAKTRQRERGDLESNLRDGAARLFPLVAAREDLNVHLQVEALRARNLLLRVRQTSKRPMIPARAEQNWDFLGLLADAAAARNVRLVFFVTPLNPRAGNFYVASEYLAFKQRLAQFCATRSIALANFENIVPADDWGILRGEPDSMHFGEAGHRLTADAIVRELLPVLGSEARR